MKCKGTMDYGMKSECTQILLTTGRDVEVCQQYHTSSKSLCNEIKVLEVDS